MAIVGKLHSLEHLFQKTSELKSLYSYLNNCLQIDHINHQTIINTPTNTEKKVELSDEINGMYAILQSYRLKNPENAFYETHIKYIDFQLMVKGTEFFEIGDKEDFEIKTPYDEEKDLIIYKKNLKTSRIRLYEGMLAIFFDSDVHAGGLDIDSSNNTVSKVVVKVPKTLVKIKL